MTDASPQRSIAAEPKSRARRFPYIALLLWALFAFAIPRAAQPLDLADVFAFPLGFFMAAQGSLIAFLLIAVLAARGQDRLDAREGDDS